MRDIVKQRLMNYNILNSQIHQEIKNDIKEEDSSDQEAL